jgi:response regulator NasT
MPASDHGADRIRVAVIADTAGAAGEIARVLQQTGHHVRPFPLSVRSAYDRVRELRPSVVLLRTSPRSYPLACAFARAAADGGPALVVLTPTGSRQSIKLALDTGALIHLVEPVPSQALVAAVRVALARAQDLRDLKTQLTKIRESVHSRSAIERAKSILMRRFKLSEDEAHRRLQRESRNRNRRIIDTAWHVIHADAALAAQERAQRQATQPVS